MTNDVRFDESLPWPVHEVSRALRDLAWTLPRPDGERPSAGQVRVDLRIPVGTDGTVCHRATVHLGVHEPGPDVCRLPLTISASRRFPTFRGTFEARAAQGDTDLALIGTYWLPLGLAGRVGDAAGGGMARASLRRFFETAVKAVKADLQATASPWRPATRPDSLRDA
jgi:hypothetical protein